MAAHLTILLILTGLTGIHSITTVSHVSVRAGASISIPCLYESMYKSKIKYLCKRYYWTSCQYVVKTNQHSSGRFSISDDKSQRIFTVTIKDLTTQDTEYYWCSVEINGGGDDGKRFYLSVTTSTPSLYVDHQEVKGYIGDEITIKCYHSYLGVTQWCRLGGTCVTAWSASREGTRVTGYGTFSTVTMSELKSESSGWYLCDRGGSQVPVHLTVTEKPATTTLPTTTTVIQTSPELEDPTVGSDLASTTVQSQQHSDSADLKTLIIPLSLLVFIVIITLFIWFMLKKHKRSKEAESSAATADEAEATYLNIEAMRQTTSRRRNTSHTETDVDVMYSSVVIKKPKDVQRTSHTETDVDVMYSSVVIKRPKDVQRHVEANNENVTYSTLA